MLFNKEWFLKHQKKLLWFANTSFGRDLLDIKVKEKILKITPESIHYFVDFRNKKLILGYEIYSGTKFAELLYKRGYYFWKAVHTFDTVFANNFKPNWNLGFDAFPGEPLNPATGSAAPVNGEVERQGVDEVWATIRAGAGTAAGDDPTPSSFCYVTATTTTDQYSRIRRGVFGFPTDVLGAGSTVLTATMSLFGTTKVVDLGNTEIDIVGVTLAANNTIATTDYGGFGTTVHGTMNTSAFDGANAYNDWVLDASGIAYISVDADTMFGVRFGWDTSGVGPTLSSAAETYIQCQFAQSANPPKLTGTYTPAPVVKPGIVFHNNPGIV